jgi:hypothetical protein
MMDEIIAAAPAPGFVTTASAYVNMGTLFYWSMVMAAKETEQNMKLSF